MSQSPMPATKSKTAPVDPAEAARVEEEIVYLAKRHRVSPAIVREIIRRVGSTERGPIEREIGKGKARR